MIGIKHINEFTSQPFSGNPAAVVTQAAGLSETQMQSLAREMNLSETAFVLKPATKTADLRLRWFTPTVEADFCGHATIASFHALAEEGRLGMNQRKSYSFRLETRVGILAVEVEKRSARKSWITLQVPKPSFSSYPGRLSTVLKTLAVTREQLHANLPVQTDQMRHLFIPLAKLSTLLETGPNFDQLKQVSQREQLHGVCLFTTETVERESAFHSRFFAPNYGINEDPVTGSSNGPLAVYLYHQGVLKARNRKCQVVGEQGDVLGRKGRVTIEVKLKDDSVHDVRISGEAVTLFEARIKIG